MRTLSAERLYDLGPTPRCYDCASWPCVCRRSVRACACGGEVAATETNPGPGVLAHQQTERHRAWWARAGWA